MAARSHRSSGSTAFLTSPHIAGIKVRRTVGNAMQYCARTSFPDLSHSKRPPLSVSYMIGIMYGRSGPGPARPGVEELRDESGLCDLVQEGLVHDRRPLTAEIDGAGCVQTTQRPARGLRRDPGDGAEIGTAERDRQFDPPASRPAELLCRDSAARRRPSLISAADRELFERLVGLFEPLGEFVEGRHRDLRMPFEDAADSANRNADDTGIDHGDGGLTAVVDASQRSEAVSRSQHCHLAGTGAGVRPPPRRQ